MLLPGYVLTLDLIFGPKATFPSYSGIASSFPLNLLIYIFQLFLNGWIVEKFLLALLFVLLFYLPLKFYPFINKHGEAYFVSLFFAINPFVYERFLAGHIAILYAYAFLFPFVSSLIRLYKDLSWRPLLYAGLWFLAIGMFSIHLLVISAFVWMTFCIAMIGKMFYEKKYQLLKTFLMRSITVFVLVFGISLYWIIPALTSKVNTVAEFTPNHWEAFKTTTDPYLATIGNVAALYGFWGENEMWATHFSSPKENVWVWIISALALSAVILTGLFAGLRNRSTRFIAGWITVVGIMSLIFSTGVGDTIFRNINTWIFANIPFWQGFRDSQKWSSLLILAYTLLGGLGAGYLLEKLKHNRKIQIIALVILCSLPLLYTPTMILGFNGQLKPVNYPKSWEQANEVLKTDQKCKALFLPWHLYYNLSFNNNILTANTAPNYFDCDILISTNAEIGKIGYSSNMPLEYYMLANTVTNNSGDPDKTIRFLAGQGIRYIIYTPDIAEGDVYKYPFLRSSLIKKIITTPLLAIFKIVVYSK